MSKKLHFETLQLHVGQEQADPVTDYRAVPIYQTTSYVFHNSQHAADRFGLRDAGNIYGRLTNSTQGVFEDRVAALEGGVAGLAVASGAAAVTYSLQNILQAGDHIVAADNLYGGSFNLITHTLTTQGISYTIVNVNDLEALDAAIEASNLLFGKSTKEGLEKLDEQTFLDVFDGVPQFEISKDQLGQPAVELFTTVAPVFPSKGEMRKMVQGGGVSLNKEKLTDQNRAVTADDLIDGKYLLAQKGKKNYYLLIVK